MGKIVGKLKEPPPVTFLGVNDIANIVAHCVRSAAAPTPLPKVGSPEVQRIADEDPDSLSVYNIRLNYEEELAAKDNNKLRHARILGFLLLHAPNPGVRSEIAKYIHSRKPGSNVTDVGAFFERNVILPCEFFIFRLHTPHANLFQSRSTEVERRNPANTPQGPPLRS